MDLLQWIKQADISALHFINKQLASPSLDALMLLLREAYTWVPLYLFFILFFYFNTRNQFVQIILLTLLTFALTDFISASILKPLIGRLRPCYSPEITFAINNLPGCGGKYSMPSSHASNHFGLASFWFLIIQNTLQKTWYWLWVWAIAIGFSQVYVGVHYPGDILAGFVFGTGIGVFCFFLFKKWSGSQNEPKGLNIINKT
ncbi:MAG TPA: phosphatase PAP2 family protein [Segetibacter sp.]|jgi:undecaprenyl-diphosphatase